jgi:hypothetical protein
MFRKNPQNSLAIVFRTLVFVIARTESDSIAVSAVKRAGPCHIRNIYQVPVQKVQQIAISGQFQLILLQILQ